MQVFSQSEIRSHFTWSKQNNNAFSLENLQCFQDLFICSFLTNIKFPINILSQSFNCGVLLILANIRLNYFKCNFLYFVHFSSAWGSFSSNDHIHINESSYGVSGSLLGGKLDYSNGLFDIFLLNYVWKPHFCECLADSDKGLQLSCCCSDYFLIVTQFSHLCICIDQPVSWPFIHDRMDILFCIGYVLWKSFHSIKIFW